MCNNGKLLEEEEMRKGKGKRKAAGSKKLSAWTGVRFRATTKWSTEIRMPRTRQKVWIGTFTSPRQAALAYDAAVFCLFGARTPKSRKVNFPAAPRPDISESARLKLSVADLKVIAEKHALYVDELLPPLADADSIAAPDDLVVVAPATPVVMDASLYGAGGPAPPYIPDEDDDGIYEMISNFDYEAFKAELDAVEFIVSEDVYNERCA